MKIALSPDEDPGQPGAVAADGTVERDVNIVVGNALKAALERCGQSVTFDTSIGVVDRVARANNDGTELIVANAHNGSRDPSVRGCQFVFAPGGETSGNQGPAADQVGKQLVESGVATQRLGNAIVNVYECWAFNRDTLYVEYLFMSNPDDLAKIHSAGYAEAAADAVARGLAVAYGFAWVPREAPPPPPAPGPTPAPTPGPGPDWMGSVTWQTFNGTIAVPTANVRSGPGQDYGVIYQLGAGTGESFDGYVHRGPEIPDVAGTPTAGTPDNIWFHISPTSDAREGWIASAIVNGGPF
jgi:hypothetical protein